MADIKIQTDRPYECMVMNVRCVFNIKHDNGKNVAIGIIWRGWVNDNPDAPADWKEQTSNDKCSHLYLVFDIENPEALKQISGIKPLKLVELNNEVVSLVDDEHARMDMAMTGGDPDEAMALDKHTDILKIVHPNGRHEIFSHEYTQSRKVSKVFP